MSDLTVRVYYEDTDSGGVLYHASLVCYLDRGRIEWLRDLGFSPAQLAQQQHLAFAVRELQVRYLKPGHLDDALAVRTQLRGSGPASLDFEQSVWRDETCLATAQVRVACVDTETERPTAMPEAILMGAMNKNG